MRLVKVKIKNFRCYKDETPFKLDDLTAIIGKNDIGKSAVVEAIDGFFNDSIEAADLSNEADSNSIEITCFFDGIPDEVVLDTSIPTSPKDEGILNAQDQLEIKKVFTFAAKKTTAIYLNANHPADERLTNLLSMKNTPLKAYAAKIGANLEDVNRRKNPPLRAAIREHIGGERQVREIKVDGNIDNEDNIKAVWSSLKKLLPIFSLFKTDKAFDDKDGDIKDPLQSAVNEALALPEIQGLLSEIELKVKEYSTDIAERTIEKLKNFDKDISERLRSDFNKPPSYSKVFDLTLLNENDIPLNKRGSGIRRLVVLSFFQAQAEKRKAEKNAPSIIYAIEEPETAQHPNHQQMIIDALHDLSKQDGVQVLFTTHSANLVREIPVESLRFISPDDDGKIKVEYGVDSYTNSTNEGVISKIIHTLGILPNPSERVKALVYVEGNHDVNALKRYSKILNEHNPDIINLMDSEAIGYVITGGSALKHYINQKHLDGLGKPEIHIYDSDVGSYVTAVQKINEENNPIKVAFNTQKLELENYLHHEAIVEAYAENGTRIELAEIQDQDDVPMLVAKSMNVAINNNWGELTHEKQKELSSNKKKSLNTVAVEKMTIERIAQRGGYDEIVSWLAEVKRLAV
ncbi:ATP-binding protein [Pseudoalteromonas sp. SCSIO 43088]|uniref:ATP-binding protein n=1 Tax=Pseudoalteromonas sp. SCSIO 43088 TaxID=2822846 RepID=UPI00202B0BA6|nr:ATP-binding protein [Pseudoalteromonas sp. SCSIO 43088]URQ85563.1 ATP-binding protein [Pseudoalteromonas sp. SCSIO 43088]